MVTKILKYSIVFALCSLFVTAFIVSYNLVDGVNTSKTFYFYGVSVIVFFLGSILLLFRKEPIKLSINKLDVALIAYYLYSVARLAFTSEVPFYNSRIVIFTFLIIYYFIFKSYFKDFTTAKFSPAFLIIISFLIAGFWQACIGTFQMQGLFGYYPSPLGSSGTLGSPNPYSGYIISVLPFAFGLYLLNNENKIYDKILKYTAGVTFFACLVVLPATKTRGGWLAAMGGMLFVFYKKYDLGNRLGLLFNKTYKKLIAATIVILLFGALMACLYNIRPASAFGRLLIWKVSANIIADYPIFGIGYDRFGQVYNRYQGEYFAEKDRDELEKYVAGNVTQAHNEYIENITELGIVGLILYLGIFYTIFRKTKPNNINKESYYNEESWMVNSAKASVISLVISSCFSYPLQILPIFINFAVILSFISSSKLNIYLIKKRFSKPNSIFLLTLLILTFYLFINEEQKKNKNYQRWNKILLYSQYQDYAEAIINCEYLYNDLKYSGHFLLNYGGILALNGEYSKAINVLNEAKKINSEPNLFILLANCYKELEEFDDAENNYLIAVNIIPHKLYPKYLLTILYIKNNKKADAIAIAGEIMQIKEKIPSSATKQIKEEIKSILK